MILLCTCYICNGLVFWTGVRQIHIVNMLCPSPLQWFWLRSRYTDQKTGQWGERYPKSRKTLSWVGTVPQRWHRRAGEAGDGTWHLRQVIFPMILIWKVRMGNSRRLGLSELLFSSALLWWPTEVTGRCFCGCWAGFVWSSPLLPPAGGDLSVSIPSALCIAALALTALIWQLVSHLCLNNLRTRLLNNSLKTLMKNVLIPPLPYYLYLLIVEKTVHKAGKVS